MVAFTGGGGKTTAILGLSRELRGRGWRVLASTTTKVGLTLARELPIVCAQGDAEVLVERALDADGAVFLASGPAPEEKLAGVAPGVLDSLASAALADVVLVEADGSRQRPIKAPADHEPVVPARAAIVSFMAGIDAVGAILDGPLVHRPELVRRFGSGPVVTPELIAALASSEHGGLKGVPDGAAARPILNKVTIGTRDSALTAAAGILDRAGTAVDRVLVTDVRGGEFLFLTRRD